MDFEKVIDLVKQTKNIILDEKLVSSVKVKGVADYVTEVDFSVQKFLQAELKKLSKDVQFLGEEAKADIDYTKPLWILDPVDGTTNMMHHMGMSAVSLALCENAHPVFSVVFNPFNNELYTAQKGKGAFLNGERIHVSVRDSLADSLIAVGTCPYHKSLSTSNFPLFQNIFEKCADIRRSGSAALDCAYVAAGRMDGYVERELMVWDMAAGILLIEEAGGTLSAFDGTGITFERNCGIIAGNKKMHTLLFEEVKNHI